MCKWVGKPQGPHAQHDNSLSLTIVNMANDNSQNPKDFEKNFLSSVAVPIYDFFTHAQRSASRAPLEGSHGHPSKSRIRRFFSKSTTASPSQSTLSFPLTSATVMPGGGTPLDPSTVAAPDAISPNQSPLMIDPSHTTPASSGSHTLATSSPPPNLDNFPHLHGQNMTASAGQSPATLPGWGVTYSPQSRMPDRL
ncbi:hypothetical protein GALMADRAFT_1232618 [Galerina marginata CBS 339.88]|uniref:Uncharacterized protein n=1 Tax=Galerina marginata (strain CBS 339.88) TaxID=685588 RepID=A0A067THA9_GALM3|nr:hypothetical protein GALMADRAFT_1232618 [Galerina marginata CBS 339.88]